MRVEEEACDIRYLHGGTLARGSPSQPRDLDCNFGMKRGWQEKKKRGGGGGRILLFSSASLVRDRGMRRRRSGRLQPEDPEDTSRGTNLLRNAQVNEAVV